MRNCICLGIVLIVIVFVAGCGPKTNRVCFGRECFTVVISKNPEERQRGLMYRLALAENEGMLFIFEEEGAHSFWMKNTYIPLDIIWINEARQVVHIKEKAQPCKETPCPSFTPEAKAHYVLEVNAGTADRLNIKKGDTVSFYLNAL